MPANSSTDTAIDRVFAHLSKPDAPGLAVGIVRDGEPIYTRCFGLANLEHRVPNTASTLFDIASMTKQFTAFAVRLLERDGKLSLDDDIREFLPELPDYDQPVRLRHCLYHTCGLIDWVCALELAGPFSDYCPFKRASRTIISMGDTMFPPGEDHSYTNTGYLLLAWVVKRVTGRSLPDFLQEHVFEPLGMGHSVFRSHPTEFLLNEAQGYQLDDEGLHRLSSSCSVYGDGGMHTSITDIMQWMLNFTSKQVGDAELFERFFAPGHLDDGQPLRYASGWELDRYRGYRVIRHGGMGMGFQSHIAWFPEVSIGVAILSNVRPCWPWPLANKVLEALVGLPASETIPTSTIGKRTAKSKDILGRYFTSTGLPAYVEWSGDRIMLDTWYSREPFERVSNNRLFHPDYSDSVMFHRDDEGRVTHFTFETDDGAIARMHGPIRRVVKHEYTDLEEIKLRAYEGRYLNDELETLYTIEVEPGGLRAKHLRCHDWRLRPIRSCLKREFEHEFAQVGCWPGKLTFDQRSVGNVIGFRVRGTGHNLYFRKL